MKKKLLLVLCIFVFIFLIFYSYLYTNYTTPILMYHSLDKARIKDFAAVSPDKFHYQMEFIQRGDYKVISLPDYCKLLEGNKPVPRNLVVITFDDGYKDNLIAFKTLKQFDYPATVFLAVDSIGKPGFLSSEEINSYLANGIINIGSHTSTHPDLTKINDEKAKKEISSSKARLEKMFSVKTDTLAYPGGAFNEKIRAETKAAGYACACTTNRGLSQALDRFALRRIKITESDNDFTLWAKLSGFYNVFKKAKKPY